MITKFKDYYKQAHATQQYRHEKTISEDMYDYVVKDPLIRFVPIYDIVNRRYAAFCSFTEAVYYGIRDPKGNGMFFPKCPTAGRKDFKYLLYLFRLCGSGINYKPSLNGEPWGTHGFGNFWIVDEIRNKRYIYDDWVANLPKKGFINNKGYIPPQISKKTGGMYGFIKDGVAKELVDHIWDNLHDGIEIYQVTEIGNEWLKERGYLRQNFALTAFAMDLAEYFPYKVKQNSKVLLGSNAVKCYKLLFPGRPNTFDHHNQSLKELCDATGNYSQPYDMEDCLCDFIRYLERYQSKDHILANNGVEY